MFGAKSDDLDFGEEDFLQNAFRVPTLLEKHEAIRSKQAFVENCTNLKSCLSDNSSNFVTRIKDGVENSGIQKNTSMENDRANDISATVNSLRSLPYVEARRESLINDFSQKSFVSDSSVNKLCSNDHLLSVGNSEDRIREGPQPCSYEDEFSDDMDELFHMAFEEEESKEPASENVSTCNKENDFFPQCGTSSKKEDLKEGSHLQLRQVACSNIMNVSLHESFPETGISSKSKPQKRKFPGPAGILPHLSQKTNLHTNHVPPLETAFSSDSERVPKVTKSEQVTCSQSSEEEFNKLPWKTLLKDLDTNGTDGNSLIARFNICWVLQQAAAKQLPKGKVPILCVIIKNISLKGAEASVVLKDKTGEISATVHRKLLEEYHNYLEPGAALILKQVSVFSPKLHRHYLNLTPNNLVCMYGSDGELLHSVASGSHLLNALKDAYSADTSHLSKSYLSTSAMHCEKMQNLSSPVLSNTHRHLKSAHNDSGIRPFSVTSSVDKSDHYFRSSLYQSPKINVSSNLQFKHSAEDRDSMLLRTTNGKDKLGGNSSSVTPRCVSTLTNLGSLRDESTVQGTSASRSNLFNISSQDQDEDLFGEDEFDKILQSVDDADLFGF